MRSRWRRLKSTLTSDKWLEPAALGEVRRLLVHLESERTREYGALRVPVDRKVVRHCNQLVANAAPAPLRARVNHRVDRTRSIRSDKPLHRPEQVRSFCHRKKTGL